MKKIIFSISLLCGMMLCGTGLYGQNATTEVINVEKSYTPQVKSQKKAQLSPTQAASSSKKLPVTYITDAPSSQVSSSSQPISAMLITQNSVEENTIYPNYIKAGFGYNISTMGELYYKGSVGKTTLWSKINHDRGENGEDSYDSNKSNYSHTDAAIGLSRNIGSYDAGVNFNYGYDSFSNNGPKYDGGTPSLPLFDVFTHNTYGAQVFITSQKDGKLFDRLVLDAGFYNGRLDSKETALNALARFNIKIRNWKISLDGRWEFYDEKFMDISSTTGSNDMMLLSLLPQVSYKKGAIDARLGARIELVGGSMDGADFHIMPEAHATFGVARGLNIYADLTSGINMNTMKEVSHMNPYISPFASTHFSLERFKASVGAEANVTEALKMDVKASYSMTEDALLWIYNSHLPQYLLGSDDVNIFSVELSGRYTINRFHSASAYIQYNSSSSDVLSSASCVPDFRIGASWAGKFANEKIGVYARLAYNSSYVVATSSSYEAENDGYIEYYGELSYKLTKRWSAFVNVNNTINGRVPAIYGFETVGLRALAGIKFNF